MLFIFLSDMFRKKRGLGKNYVLIFLVFASKFTLFDGQSYYETLQNGTETGYDSVVLMQCARVVQRSAIFDQYLYIRTIHGGGHMFEDEMLFDLSADVHQQNNIASEKPELLNQGARIIFNWQNKYMEKSPYTVDPIWTVMKEGGPQHAHGMLEQYAERLKETGRDYISFKKKYHLV